MTVNGHTSEAEQPTVRHEAARDAVIRRCVRYCADVMRARKDWWRAMEAKARTETDEDGDGADGVYESDASAAWRRCVWN